MPIIPQSLNINNLRIRSAKSIKLHAIRKLSEYSLKNVRVEICVFLPFLNVGRYYHPPSGVHGSKGLRYKSHFPELFMLVKLVNKGFFQTFVLAAVNLTGRLSFYG